MRKGRLFLPIEKGENPILQEEIPIGDMKLPSWRPLARPRDGEKKPSLHHNGVDIGQKTTGNDTVFRPKRWPKGEKNIPLQLKPIFSKDNMMDKSLIQVNAKIGDQTASRCRQMLKERREALASKGKRK